MKAQNLPAGNSRKTMASKVKLAAATALVSIFCGMTTHPFAQTINTVVGIGGYASGYAGDGGPATAATIGASLESASDHFGNFYFVDGNAIVRKVNSVGIISTLAGNYSLGTGYSGDGGPATNAQFGSPYGLTTDAAGNVYIGDYYNHVVRKVNVSTGIITNYAGNGTAGNSGDGGAATAAQMNGVTGLSMDPSGNLYITDPASDVIRKVSASGIISTVTGTGTYGYSGDGGPASAAAINYPQGVTTDVFGNVFFADASNYVIRRIDAATNTITTYAGTGSWGYSGDGGPATSADIFAVGVAVNNAGELYFSDASHSVIRKVDLSGIITTYAGIGSYGYSGDGGAATAAQLENVIGLSVNDYGDLFIGVDDDGAIRKVTPIHSCVDASWMTGTSVTNGSGDCDFTLTTHVSTINYATGYLWSGAGPDAVHHNHGLADNFTFTVPAGSTYTVTATAFIVDTNLTDPVSGPCCQAVLTHTAACSSTGDGTFMRPGHTTEVKGINVFPNPTDNAVTVTSDEEIKTIEVLSVNGKQVAIYKYENVQTATISLDNLAAGTYLFRINNTTTKTVSKTK